MTSKEVIEKILNSPITKVRSGSYLDIEIIESIKQSLDRLEKLEKENQVLREKLKIIYEHKLLNPYKNPKLRVLYKLTDEQYEFIKENK